MKRQSGIKTKRLLLLPMTAEELAEKAAAETDAHMKNAYGQMREGMLSEPEMALWHTAWRLVRRDTGETVGDACFKGAPVAGEAEIGYGVEEAQRGNGYTAEAVNALLEWAFDRGAYLVIAEAEQDNAASQGVLTACGFRRIGEGGEGERWEKEKERTNWLSIYMCLGLSVGVAFGAAFGGEKLATGMCLGMCAGIALGSALGASLDAAERRTRARVTAPPEEETPAEAEQAPEETPPAETETPSTETPEPPIEAPETPPVEQ